MKKILKRLGIFGLLLAVLIPFLDLPVVKATTGDCKQGMNVYLFLDVFNGNEISDYTQTIGHRNYAQFDYAMPVNATITNVKRLDLDSDASQEDFYNTYKEVYSSGTDATDKKYSYEDLIKKQGINLSFDTNSNYKDGITYIIHGKWAEVDDGATKTTGTNDYSVFNSDGRSNLGEIFPTVANFKKSIIQRKINYQTLTSEIGLGYLDSTGTMAVISGTSFGNDNFRDAFNTNISKNYSSALTKKYITEYDSMPKVITAINRKVSDTSDLKIGYYDANADSIKVYSSDSSSIKNSYSTYQNCALDDNLDDCTFKVNELATNVNIFTDNYDTYNKNQYYWPEEYQVTYEVCDTTSTEKVSLTYDGNTDDSSVKNIPATQSYEVNEEVTVQAGASRDNYAFKKWCTEKDGTGKCYMKDDTFNISSDTTLYAQWGEEGTTENGKTGIVSYMIGFASVGIVASGIYLISKKKNLFKQI